MNVKRLKELLENLDDDLEVFIRNSYNITGNICDLHQIEVSQYGFFGTLLPCIILNSGVSDMKKNEDDEYIDFIIDKK